MKQGILIIANRDLKQLLRLIEAFDDNFYFFIHIDRKSDITVDQLQNRKNVLCVLKSITINWGSLSMVKCTKLLIQEFLKYPDLQYAHLISGLDYPIQSSENITRFLNLNKGKQFITFTKLPVPWTEWGGHGGLDRLYYFYFLDFFNVRKKIGGLMAHGIVRLQKILPFSFRRKIKKQFPEIYMGSQWWTLSRDCLLYIDSYMKADPTYEKRFSNTYIPDEMFFQTLLMNSVFNDQCVNDNKRYYDWNVRDDRNERPAVLDETDLNALLESDAFFARKVTSEVSTSLLDILNKIKLSKDI